MLILKKRCGGLSIGFKDEVEYNMYMDSIKFYYEWRTGLRFIDLKEI